MGKQLNQRLSSRSDELVWGHKRIERGPLIIWNAPETWTHLIEQFLSSKIDVSRLLSLTVDVRQKFEDGPAKFDFYGKWRLGYEATCFSPDYLARSLAHYIIDNRIKIRVYHGARPRSVKTFYEKGILPSNLANIRRDVLRVAKKVRARGADYDAIKAYVRERRSRGVKRIDNGYAFVVYDDRLIAMWEHSVFVSVGSEEFASYFTPEEIEKIVERRYPTVILAKIPPQALEFDSLFHFSGKLLEEFLRLRVAGTNIPTVNSFAPAILGGVKPKCVVGHYHPSLIGALDYNRNLATVFNRRFRCPHCTASASYSMP